MIYFIKLNDFVKIGFSDDVSKRVAQLQTSSPYNLDVLCIIEGDYDKEKELHELFKQYSARGEWFYLSEEILEYIKSCKDLKWSLGFEKQEDVVLNPLKKLRLSLNMSMEEAAQKIGVTKQSYQASELRCLQGKITIGTLAKYAKAFGANLEYRIVQKVN